MAKTPANTRELKELKRSLKLSLLQREVIIGTILGDGCLMTSYSGDTARLQIRHQVKCREYVDWKYSFFTRWVLTPPRLDIHNNSWFFQTVSHTDLMEIKRLFYVGRQRVIPKNIVDLLKTPLSLAM